MENRHYKQILSLSLTFFIFTLLASTASARSMKIAVPANGMEQDALISQETGRAPFFLFFDEKGQFLKAIKNPGQNQSGGISRTVAALLSDNDITVVIADSVGEKMKKALSNHNIQLLQKTGTARNGVTAVLSE